MKLDWKAQVVQVSFMQPYHLLLDPGLLNHAPLHTLAAHSLPNRSVAADADNIVFLSVIYVVILHKELLQKQVSPSSIVIRITHCVKPQVSNSYTSTELRKNAPSSFPVSFCHSL